MSDWLYQMWMQPRQLGKTAAMRPWLAEAKRLTRDAPRAAWARPAGERDLRERRYGLNALVLSQHPKHFTSFHFRGGSSGAEQGTRNAQVGGSSPPRRATNAQDRGRFVGPLAPRLFDPITAETYRIPPEPFTHTEGLVEFGRSYSEAKPTAPRPRVVGPLGEEERTT